jgi:ubiquitin thioesterase protein OTUB1
MMLEQLEVLERNPSPSVLERVIFNDSSVDGYLIALMRCCCGSFLKQNSDEFAPILPEGFSSIDQFVRSEVDPMSRDCEYLQVVALSKALNVRLKIVYLDQSDGAPTVHQFGESCDDAEVALLYKPGHYDVLYPA